MHKPPVVDSHGEAYANLALKVIRPYCGVKFQQNNCRILVNNNVGGITYCVIDYPFNPLKCWYEDGLFILVVWWWSCLDTSVASAAFMSSIDATSRTCRTINAIDCVGGSQKTLREALRITGRGLLLLVG